MPVSLPPYVTCSACFFFKYSIFDNEEIGDGFLNALNAQMETLL